MNKGMIYEAIKNRKVTLFTVVLLILLGLYNYYMIPKQEAPDISPPVAIITTIYPGASPEDVEELVTRKIEDEVSEIKGYDYSESNSKNSVSIVILKLAQDADVEKAWPELRQKMEDLQSELPEGCSDIEINTDVTETAGMIISMSGENYSYEELAAYAEVFKKELSKISGVSRFDITGKQEKEVKVEVDTSLLNYYSLSLEDVVKIVQAQNIQIPSGQINDHTTKINVKTSDPYTSLKDIENTVIAVSKETGAVVRLRDIAEVFMDFEDANYKIKHNGKNAVLLTGYFQESKNIVIIGDEVEKRIEALKKNLPRDIVFDQVLYQPKDVQKSVNNFVLNLAEGIVFVIIVVFVGMGFRNAIIVSTAIPLSICMTFIFMNLFEIKVHQVSVVALIIALGMLVDNAIVVSDAIQVRLDRGEERTKACIDGVKEVAIPILTSTLTTIGAFIPLMLLPSIAGEYIISIPQIVIISLLSSYLTALFVTPVMAYMFFQESKREEKTSKLRRFFEHALQWSMKRKKQTFMITLLALTMAGIMATQLGLQFFPKADKNILYIDVKTEQSTDIDKTEDLADKVSDILKKESEIIRYTAAIGDGLPKFYDTIPVYTQAQDFAQFMIAVDLKKGDRFKNNTELADYLQEMFDREISGGAVTVKQLEQGEPIGAPIRIRVSGSDINRLQEVAEEIKDELRQVDGTVNIDDDFEERNYEFHVDVDTDIASSYGISKYDIQKEVSIALRGKEASVFRKGGNEYNILIKSNIVSKEALENLTIKSSVTGKKVVLKELGSTRLAAQVPNIKKHDKDMTITVYSDVKSGFSSVQIQKNLVEKLEDMATDDVEIVFDGEKEKINENFGNMGTSSIMALLLIYGILLVQFNSFTQPFIILLTVPMSVIGSIFGLFIFRQNLSFTALLGIVSLVGIVVNNAIVLIDFINEERRNGHSIETACLEAVDKRFRPIMLSTTTTVIGLTPLVFSGSSLFTPMSISLMSGLMISTLLTLVLIPLIYSMMENKMLQFSKEKKILGLHLQK
ncbi:MAG: efflux RND transporter permease subunit [Bacillota bacterium]